MPRQPTRVRRSHCQREELWEGRNEPRAQPHTKAERELIRRERRKNGLAAGIMEWDVENWCAFLRAVGHWKQGREPTRHEQLELMRDFVKRGAAYGTRHGHDPTAERIMVPTLTNR